MPRYADAKQMFSCPRPYCACAAPWPIEAGMTCPVCGATGIYRGIAVKDLELTPEEEAARTVKPITEFEHAPPEAQPGEE